MKKVISLLLVVVICCTCLFGCGKQTPPETEPPIQEQPTETPTSPVEDPTEPSVTEPENPVAPTNRDILVSDFYAKFIDAMNASYEKDNYMVSPASLKMAFVLAAAGANGETLDKIVNEMGYESLDEYLQWADGMNKKAAAIAELKNINTFMPVNTPEYSIGYGIWHNIDAGGKILDSYIDAVTPLGATVDNLRGDDLMPEINNWISQKTNQMIPQMFNLDDKKSPTSASCTRKW